MWVTTIISIIAIYFAYLSQFKSKGKFLGLGFILLTIIASIQYGYGTDYMRYYELWQIKYNSLDINDLIKNFFGQTDWTEPGWMLLNTIFGFNYGFFVLVAIISIIENYIYYRLIKDYVPKKWRWFAVFLYVGLDSLYILNFSMLRQGLTVSLFVAAVMCMNKMNKKGLLIAILLITFALTIHLSSAVCIPFIALYFVPLKKTKTIAFLLLVLTIVIFLFKNVVISGLQFMFSFEELSKYSGYGKKTLSGVGIGYVLKMLPNLVILYALLIDSFVNSRERNLIAILAFCDILITPLQFYGADLAGRLGVYFIAFKVAAIPVVFANIKSNSIRSIFVLLTIFITLVMYIQFFQIYIEGYSEGFKTIFTVI